MAPAAAVADNSRPHMLHIPSTQRFSTGFPTTNNVVVTGVTPPQVSPQLVQASCAKCTALLGALLNSWVPVTNTYYLQSQTSYRATGLEVKGEPKPPGNADSALSGCLIQALMCTTPSCREVLAFTCFRAPDSKASYRGRQFFKLSKIILTSMATKKTVEPITERPNSGAAPLSMDIKHPPQQNQLVDITHTEPISPNMDATRDDFTDADKVAVQGTNDGSMTWKEAHEDWSVKTQRTMSPGAFGKRILKFGGGLNPKPAGAPPNERAQQISHPQNGFAPNRSSMQQVQMVTPKASQLQPQQQALQQPQQQQQQQQQQPQHPQQPQQHQQSQQQQQQQQSQHQQQPQFQQSAPAIQQYRAGPIQTPNVGPTGLPHYDGLEQQRRDINRIDVAVGQLQISIEILNRSVEAIGKEMQKRPTTTPAVEDQSAFELLSETVSAMTTKTGEVDGLKIQMEALKRRIKRLEDTNGVGPGTPSNQNIVQTGNVSSQQHHEYPFPGQGLAQQAGLSNNKRPAVPQFVEAPGQAYKRSRVSDADVQIDSARSSPTATYPSGSYMNPDGDPLDGWLPDSSGAGSFRGGNTPGRRGPGRPRKYPTPDLGTPIRDQDQWDPHMEADGYYHSLAPAPSTDERGRIIRRGSLGGNIHMSGKRTRQRPVRNSEGVLIRKDGKPDQRSISSAQNLKKFYNKKIAQLEMEKDGTSHAGGGGETGEGEDVGDDHTPDADGSRNSADPMAMDVDSDVGGDANEAGGGNDLTKDASNAVNQHHHQHAKPNPNPTQAHTEIMRKMFPNGISGEATALDQSAAQLFDPGKSQVAPLARMQPREEIVKKEVISDDGVDLGLGIEAEPEAAKAITDASTAASPSISTTGKSPAPPTTNNNTNAGTGTAASETMVGAEVVPAAVMATAPPPPPPSLAMLSRIIPDSQQMSNDVSIATDSS